MIDLTTAAPGDEFVTRHGKVMTYLILNRAATSHPHVLTTENGITQTYSSEGHFHSPRRISQMDLVSCKPESGAA